MKKRFLEALVLGVIAASAPAAILPGLQSAVAGSAGGDDRGTRQAVVRVAFLEGTVSFNRGDDPGSWQPASVNYPMISGDRLWAARERAELELRGGRVFLGPGSELAALDLTRDGRQLALTIGKASFRIARLERGATFEVATPNVSVTFETPGSFRIDVDENGNSRVSVHQGRAWAAAAGGQVALESGDQVRVWGVDLPSYEVVSSARVDLWDRWVDGRSKQVRPVRSASYLHPDIHGAADLDAYGSWETGSEYGPVWFPAVTAAGWAPYRDGRWIWRDPWGWTWLSSEPWGWAPYHHGRWAVVRRRWCWVPAGPDSLDPAYSPAVVGFAGGGAGWSVSTSGGGFIGWFPLGPREPFDRWWLHSRSTVDVTGFSYAYRGRATVVARTVFAQGGRVDRDLVRDAGILREIETAPVLRGPIPVLPTRESIRVGRLPVEGRAATQPPERIVGREIVTRTVPPPLPPSFDRKLTVIREEGGEPVPADVGRRLSADERRGGLPFRPAARERVLLSPRGAVKPSRQPRPLLPSADRPAGRDKMGPTPVLGPRREEPPASPTVKPPG